MSSVSNVFCATGEGGGVDPTCSPGQAAPISPGQSSHFTSKAGVPYHIKNLHDELISVERVASMRKTFESMPRVLQEVAVAVHYNPKGGSYARPGIAIVIGDKVGDSRGKYLHEAGHNLQATRTKGEDWDNIRKSGEFPHGWTDYTKMGSEDFAESVKLYVLDTVPHGVAGQGQKKFADVFPKRAEFLKKLIDPPTLPDVRNTVDVLDDVVEYGFSSGRLMRVSSLLASPQPRRDHALAPLVARYAGYSTHALALNATAVAMREQVGDWVELTHTVAKLVVNGFAAYDHNAKESVLLDPGLDGWERVENTDWIGGFREWLVANAGGMVLPPRDDEARAGWVAAAVQAANDGDVYKLGGLFSLTGNWEKTQPRAKDGKWTKGSADHSRAKHSLSEMAGAAKAKGFLTGHDAATMLKWLGDMPAKDALEMRTHLTGKKSKVSKANALKHLTEYAKGLDPEVTPAAKQALHSAVKANMQSHPKLAGLSDGGTVPEKLFRQLVSPGTGQADYLLKAGIVELDKGHVRLSGAKPPAPGKPASPYEGMPTYKGSDQSPAPAPKATPAPKQSFKEKFHKFSVWFATKTGDKEWLDKHATKNEAADDVGDFIAAIMQAAEDGDYEGLGALVGMLGDDDAVQNWNPLQARDKTGKWTKVPNPAGVKFLKNLGGHGGSPAKLVEDAQGRKWVMKAGGAKDHLVNEATADEAYRRLGLNVPEGGLHVAPDGTVTKFTRFLEGAQTLSQFEATNSSFEVDKVKAEIAKGFAADALMGNWDVIGATKDNIMITPDGKVWRVDNGGALAYRAQGAKKTESEFGTSVDELANMMNPSKNANAAAVFGGLTPAELKNQAMDMMALSKTKFLESFSSDSALQSKMAARWDNTKKQIDAMQAAGVGPVAAKFALPDDPMKQVDWGSHHADMASKYAGGGGGMFSGTKAKDIPGWAHLDGLGDGKVAYGAVLYRKNEATGEYEVLLRKPTGNFDGYHWTFPKGGHTEDHPLATAKKEVGEEVGLDFNPTGHLDKTFKSPDGKENAFFIGEAVGKRDLTKMDGETEAIKWVPLSQAAALIGRGKNVEGVQRDLNVLATFGHQMGASVIPKPASSTPTSPPPLPVGAKVVEPLHTAGGLYKHLKAKGTISESALKQIAFMNPDGMKSGKVYIPKSKDGVVKTELLKLLPPGTVATLKTVKKEEMAGYTVPATPKVGTTAVPAPTSPPTYKVPDSITAKVKKPKGPSVGGVDVTKDHPAGSGEHTVKSIVSSVHKDMTKGEIEAVVAQHVQALAPEEKGKLKAMLGIPKGQQGTNEKTVKAVLASVDWTPQGHTPAPASPPPPPTPTATPTPKPAGKGTAGSGSKPAPGKQAGGTFVKPTKPMSIDGVHAVTHADAGAKASDKPINSVPVSVFAGHAFHQVDEAHLPDYSVKLPEVISGKSVKLPTNKDYVSNEVQAAWHAQLTGAESSAVDSWKSSSTGVRRKIYDALKEGTPITGEALHIITAIQKAPPQPGVYYRGLNGAYADKLVGEAKKAMETGNEAWMYDVAPHGMSTNPGTASGFSGGKTVLRIVSKSARSLRGIHNYNSEDEILGVPGARYRVKAIHTNVTFEGKTHDHVIDMEEI